MFLSNIDPSLIATQGTDIARAIDMATKSFTKQDKVGRAIIVITDGEDHEGGAKEAALNEGHEIQDYQMVFPIPSSELERINNTDLLWQNAGY